MAHTLEYSKNQETGKRFPWLIQNFQKKIKWKSHISQKVAYLKINKGNDADKNERKYIMCTIMTQSETLPAEKRSRKASQEAVDKLMAYDKLLSEPFTRNELNKLFPLGDWAFMRGK